MTKQRTEKEILSDLRTAQESYATVAADENSTQAQVRDAGTAVKKLTSELDAYVSHRANLCTNVRSHAELDENGDWKEWVGPCNIAPMGMLKTPGYYDQAKGLDVPAVWEVGCIHCPPQLVEREDGKKLRFGDGEAKKVKRRSFSARALTPAEAVRKWNEGELVEDFLFDRIPGFKPEHVTE